MDRQNGKVNTRGGTDRPGTVGEKEKKSEGGGLWEMGGGRWKRSLREKSHIKGNESTE